MLSLTEYDMLVLRAFEALRREITEAENYTVQHHTAIIAQQKEAQKQQEEEAKQQEAEETETKKA